MKAVFVLFVIVAIIGMAMAGVHHYRVDGNGGQAAPVPIRIFDLGANILTNIKSGIDGIL